MPIISGEQFFRGKPGTIVQSVPEAFPVEEEQPGYLERVGTGLKETFTGLKEDIQTQQSVFAGAKPRPSGAPVEQVEASLRGGVRTVGALAEAAFTPLLEAPGIKQATEFVGSKLAGTEPMQKYAEWSQKYPEASKDIENVLDISGIFGATKGVQAGIKTGIKGAKTGIAGAKAGVQTGKQLMGRGQKALGPPPPTPQQAIGQVLQGKPRDIVSGAKAFKALDTTGVKTYGELSGKINESIVGLSKKVDEVLDNTTSIGLEELKLTGKTAAGKAVSVDYVSRALEHLKELYTSIGDDVALQNMDDILTKAKTQGLTRLEVNNLSRQYGIEFGEKAFSKIGEPRTSVNAVKFENTRSALKTIARQGLSGKIAQEMDKSISSLYRVKDLVRKNTEAVNKLQQRIQERGLVEKFGYKAAKTLDVLTGGGIRGIVGGLLPRGVGYKVMNALDLEQVLQRNLDIIQKALKAGDKELLEIIKRTDRPNP